MSVHFKKLCRECGKVILECRCPAPDKAVEYGICADCLRRRGLP